MPDFNPNSNFGVPISQDLLNLGQHLKSSNTLSNLEFEIQRFFKKHYCVNAYIVLQNYPKNLIEQSQIHNFPFDINNFICDDCSKDYHEIQVESDHWIIITLKNANRPFGLLIIQHENYIDEINLKILISISEFISTYIYSMLQSQLNDWREKQLSLVRLVSERISQITDLNLLTKQITELTRETFNYYYVAIFLINPESERLIFKASSGSNETDRPDFEHLSHPGYALGEHMIGHVAKTGQELIAPDVSSEQRYKKVDSLSNTKSEVVIPLKVEDRIFGVFDVQSDVINAFNEDDLLVLRALANSISLAVESTYLLQGIQTTADQLAAVSEVSRAITLILDTDELLKKIVHLIHEKFRFPFVHLYTIDPVNHKISFRAGSGLRTILYEKSAASFDISSNRGIIPWVVQNKKTRRINNVTNDPLFLASPYTDEVIGSEMAIPLLFGGEILGVLDIQSDQINAFTVDDQKLIETLADNIAIAIRNARLYRSEKWRRQVAESMRDVAGLLSENINIKNLLIIILEKLQEILPCDVAGIWLIDNDDETDKESLEIKELQLAAYQTVDDYSSESLGEVNLVPDSWIKHALIQKEPTIRQPEDPIGPIAKKYMMAKNYSSIAAPLHIGGETLGMLLLVHHSASRYGTESQKITSVFASYAAIAIKNNWLYTASQEQAWISTILLQVAQATQSLTDIDELVRTIVRITPLVTGVKGCALFLRAEESKIFSLHALYGIGDSKEEFQLNEPIALVNAPLLDELEVTREPLYAHNPKEDFNLPESLTHQLENDNLIVLPLISRNEILGAFMLAYELNESNPYGKANTFSEERLRIIQGIIQQTAIAVENIRLLEGKQEEAYVSTVLLQAAQAVVSNLDLDDTLDSIVNIMPILVGIETNMIYLWNEDEQVFTLSHATIDGKNSKEELIGLSFQLGEFPLLDSILKDNQPTAYPFIESIIDPEDWDLIVPAEGQIDPISIVQMPYPVLMAFPLAMKDDVLGAFLTLDMNYASNRERRFELISGIAQQASLAIQNDLINRQLIERQHLEREFQLAREIQRTFLPTETPKLIGWEVDVRWETARQVGGDFYDYFLLPDGRLAIVIADVSDKGLAASLYMAVTRTLIRATAPGTPSPARTLERVNDLLLGNSQNGLFVTVFYGVLCPETGLLTYTIAGHNPPMILKNKTQQVSDIGKGGIAIGAMPNINLKQMEIILEEGDCLVMYTDGVTEAFNNNDDMYGNSRLKSVLSKSIGLGAFNVVENLEADINDFRGNASLSDDTTILALCRKRLLTD
jgi:serine phosphatase RsbU (regulator of sigma subunit)/putative methionine-R-sulfoxide reductase with GAF domain